MGNFTAPSGSPGLPASDGCRPLRLHAAWNRGWGSTGIGLANAKGYAEESAYGRARFRVTLGAYDERHPSAPDTPRLGRGISDTPADATFN